MPSPTQTTTVVTPQVQGTGVSTVPEPGVPATPGPLNAEVLSTTDPEGQETLPTEGLSPEALQAELKRTRREAAAYRTKLRQAEEARAAEERAKLTDAERLKQEVEQLRKDLEEAKAKAQRVVLENAITTAAQKAGFRDPDDALRFIDESALEVQEDGTIEGLDKAIQGVVKSKPYLLREKPAPSIGTTNPPGAPAKTTDAQLRQELFGGSLQGPFWTGAGVVS